MQNYARQTLDTPNPIARFAHQRRHRLSIGKAMELLDQGQILLDYGCGQGAFLSALREQRPDLRLLGFDPESKHGSDDYEHLSDTAGLASGSLHLISAFEVLEHLYDEERERFYAESRRLLDPEGRLLVSVPIIGGPTLLLKELNQMFLHHRRPEYSLGELLRATFLGIPAERAPNRRISHRGFDFRLILNELEQSFQILEIGFSPFRYLPWTLNSQVFVLCTLAQT